jgi:hypothetical protein
VPRQTRSRTSSAAPPADSHVLKFVSRTEQLQLRGRRNFDRYMRVIKKYVSFDGPKHAPWLKESAEDAVWDAVWKQRHGPVPGGVRVLRWRHWRELQALPLSIGRREHQVTR